MDVVFRELSDEILIEYYDENSDVVLAEFVIRYMPLITYKARSISAKYTDIDDVIQEGLIGLFYAVRKFSTERKTLFKTFATYCITNRIISAVKANKKFATRKCEIPLSLDDDTLSDILEYNFGNSNDPQELFIQMEDSDLKRQIINKLLSDFEKDALSLYLSGHSYKEIAESLSCSTKNVDNTLQKVRKKLRE